MKQLLFVSVLLYTGFLFSQNNGTIQGSVADAAMNNEPMIFANITLVDSDISYETNFHGNFEIPNLSPGSHTLLISYAGYQTKKVELLVKANTVATIETVLSPMEINTDAIEGIDTTVKQGTAIPAHSEK